MKDQQSPFSKLSKLEVELYWLNFKGCLQVSTLGIILVLALWAFHLVAWQMALTFGLALLLGSFIGPLGFIFQMRILSWVWKKLSSRSK
jgi:hypothetical protein